MADRVGVPCMAASEEPGSPSSWGAAGAVLGNNRCRKLDLGASGYSYASYIVEMSLLGGCTAMMCSSLA